MPTFYFREEGHTLASALRAELEATNDGYVACTVLHPLDSVLHVDAPSAAAVRVALQRVKTKITQARVAVTRAP